MASSNQILLSGSLTFCVLYMNVLLSISIPLPSSTSKVSSDNSGKLCTGRQYFHNETLKCYKERSKGPCTGENMVFLRLDKIYGDCDCTDDGYLPWVYNPDTDSCHKAYQKSYCSDGMWLIFDKMDNPICTANPCEKVTTNDNDGEEHPIVLFKDKCVRLNAPSELCQNVSGELVKILKTEVSPQCVSNLDDYSVLKTSSLRCKAGSRRDRNGTCRRTATAVAAGADDE